MTTYGTLFLRLGLLRVMKLLPRIPVRYGEVLQQIPLEYLISESYASQV